jgi:O-acetyl-ADP-ribose deacetylase (regulator of RNase III)
MVEIIKGDITRLKVDALVNRTLLGGGGVDGAVHRAAGPGLLKECAGLNGCPTGEVRITEGYQLPVRYVIHAVGPVWSGGDCSEDALLASCYRKALRLAEDYRLRTIAFPCISTGIYRFPFERACRIALREISRALRSASSVQTVYCVCFSEKDFAEYRRVMREMQEAAG